MPKPKKSFKFYFILSSFLAILIFSSGISIGVLVNTNKENYLGNEIIKLKESVQDTELELMLMDYLSSESMCNYFSLKSSELMNDAKILGSEVDYYEKTIGQRNEEYLLMKSDYMKVLVKNWINIEKIRQSCGSNYTTLLYFYQTKEQCPDCSMQGFILSHLKDKYDSNLMVFSFDSSLDIGVLNIIENNYNVTTYPSIVINGQLFSGFTNMSIIEELI
jgi:hypothetical protein